MHKTRDEVLKAMFVIGIDSIDSILMAILYSLPTFHTIRADYLFRHAQTNKYYTFDCVLPLDIDKTAITII